MKDKPKIPSKEGFDELRKQYKKIQNEVPSKELIEILKQVVEDEDAEKQQDEIAASPRTRYRKEPRV